LVVDDYIGAVFGHEQCGGPTDSARPSRNQTDFSVKILHNAMQVDSISSNDLDVSSSGAFEKAVPARRRVGEHDDLARPVTWAQRACWLFLTLFCSGFPLNISTQISW
jgi:hypothetical protein